MDSLQEQVSKSRALKHHQVLQKTGETTATKIGKFMAAPIMRMFGCLCCFNNNTQSVKEETKNLEDTRVGPQMQVDEAKNNAEVSLSEVETWLKSAMELLAKAHEIETQYLKVQSNCLAIKSRYSLGKKARKLTKALKELRESKPVFQRPMKFIPSELKFIPLELS